MQLFLATLLAAASLTVQAAPPGYHSPRRYYTAQHKPYRRPPARLAVGLNVATYNGDLTSRVRDNTLRVGLNVGLVRPLSPRVSFGADFAYVKLKAVDQYPERGLRFEGDNELLTAFVRYNLLADKSMFIGPSYRPSQMQVFVQAGLGAMLYNPSAAVTGPEGVGPLPPEGTDSYPGLAAVLPVGGGVTLRATRALHFTAEALYYFTTTDLLDGVSQRANPDTNDNFAVLNFKVEYAFYKKKGKPLVHFD